MRQYSDNGEPQRAVKAIDRATRRRFGRPPRKIRLVKCGDFTAVARLEIHGAPERCYIGKLCRPPLAREARIYQYLPRASCTPRLVGVERLEDRSTVLFLEWVGGDLLRDAPAPDRLMDAIVAIRRLQQAATALPGVLRRIGPRRDLPNGWTRVAQRVASRCRLHQWPSPDPVVVHEALTECTRAFARSPTTLVHGDLYG